MNNVNKLFVISAVFVPLLLISLSYSEIQDFYAYSVPLNKMVLWENPLFNDPYKFVETSEKKRFYMFYNSLYELFLLCKTTNL